MLEILKHNSLTPKKQIWIDRNHNTSSCLNNEPIDFVNFIPYKEKIDSDSILSWG